MEENSQRDWPVGRKTLGNFKLNKCEFSNFFLFQRPKMISVLVTWVIVDGSLAVWSCTGPLLSCDQNEGFLARLETLTLGQGKKRGEDKTRRHPL